MTTTHQLWTRYDERPGYRAPQDPFARRDNDGFSFVATANPSLTLDNAAKQIQDLFPTTKVDTYRGKIVIDGKGSSRGVVWLNLLDAHEVISDVNGIPTAPQRRTQKAKPVTAGQTHG